MISIKSVLSSWASPSNISRHSNWLRQRSKQEGKREHASKSMLAPYSGNLITEVTSHQFLVGRQPLGPTTPRKEDCTRPEYQEVGFLGALVELPVTES